MLYINLKDRSIAKSRIEHYNAVSCRIRKKINGKKCENTPCKVCDQISHKIKNIPYALEQILMDNYYLEMIINGTPETLIILNEMIWNELINTFDEKEYIQYLKIRKKKFSDLKEYEPFIFKKYDRHYKLLVSIFDYTGWFYNADDQDRYDAYLLASNLDRRTCTYCNRIWTSTIKNKNNRKVMRPNYDHWYPQTHFPTLALSFCNLIPSCTVCNSSIKNDEIYTLDTHLHPYMDTDSLQRFRYSYDFFRSTNTMRIKIVGEPKDRKVFRTYYDLKLEDVYNAHHAELNDLIDIKTAYSEKYMTRLIENFDITNLSVEEIYRLAFGAEYQEDNFYKKPLSKFKKDILKELKIIE